MNSAYNDYREEDEGKKKDDDDDDGDKEKEDEGEKVTWHGSHWWWSGRACVRMVVAVREVAVEEEKETCGGMATTGRAAFWHGGWLAGGCDEGP